MRKTAAQRAIELKERDLQALVRSLQHWGDIRFRGCAYHMQNHFFESYSTSP